jgi:hypothetical protein
MVNDNMDVQVTFKFGIWLISGSNSLAAFFLAIWTCPGFPFELYSILNLGIILSSSNVEQAQEHFIDLDVRID